MNKCGIELKNNMETICVTHLYPASYVDMKPVGDDYKSHLIGGKVFLEYNMHTKFDCDVQHFNIFTELMVDIISFVKDCLLDRSIE